MWNIDQLFVVGGRGGNAAAEHIHRECRAKKVPCCVVAVPKSIDNDLLLVSGLLDLCMCGGGGRKAGRLDVNTVLLCAVAWAAG